MSLESKRPYNAVADCFYLERESEMGPIATKIDLPSIKTVRVREQEKIGVGTFVPYTVEFSDKGGGTRVKIDAISDRVASRIRPKVEACL